MTTDCNSRYVFADPYKGAMIAVGEAARNIVCSGGLPLGVTNCLNFGNPYDPEVYFQFVQAVKGMGEACLRFDTPVTGGNVSFYNQHPEGAVYPTPTIGMVGLLEDISQKMTMHFKEVGDLILLIGKSRNDIGSSAYVYDIHGVRFSQAPHFELEEEFSLQQMITQLVAKKLVASAHDVAEGGLFVTLAEAAFENDLGFDVEAGDATIRKDAYYFGEAQSRVVVSVHPSKLASVKKILGDFSYEELGHVSSGQVIVDNKRWGDIHDFKQLHSFAIENEMISSVEL